MDAHNSNGDCDLEADTLQGGNWEGSVTANSQNLTLASDLRTRFRQLL